MDFFLLCYNEKVKKIPQMCWCFLIAWAAILTQHHPVLAAEYLSPVFATSLYKVQAVSLLLDHSSPQSVQLFYQSKQSSDTDDLWRPLTDDEFICRSERTHLWCHTQLQFSWQEWGQFKLIYPDKSQLLSFNLNLEEQYQLPIATPADDDVYYSSWKNFTTPNEFQAISWNEVNLTPEASQATIIQTRASFNQRTWTPWQGNFTATPLQEHYLANLDEHGLTLTQPTREKYLLLTYQDKKQPLRATQALAVGESEVAAFAQRTFTLESLEGLQIGQEIVISEQVAGITYQVKTIIADLKPATKQVSTYPFFGTIPPAGETSCGAKQKYCFSPQAQIYAIKDKLLPINDIHINWQETIDPAAIVSLSLIEPTPSSCVAANETAPYCSDFYLPLNLTAPSATALATIQYRLLTTPDTDKLVKNVYLLTQHPQQTQVVSSSATPTATTVGRLRSGKNLVSGMGKPSFWQ